VAIARAFVNRPLILLADEPTGNLDPTTSEGIMALLERINRTGTTVVVATHDEVLVDKMRRRVIELHNGTLVRDQARGVYGIHRGAGALVPEARAVGLADAGFGRLCRARDGCNLWRNRLMTIAAILTVAVSLSLVGAALLLKQGAANAEVDWQRGTQVTVWMVPTASTSEINAVGSQLKALPAVHTCVYRNHAYDFAEAKKLLSDAVSSAGLTEAQVPTSWRCTPTHPADAQVVISEFAGQAGVDKVTAPLQEIHTMEETITVLQWVFPGDRRRAPALGCGPDPQHHPHGHLRPRREVSVMKLVGATNWFIRVPFISEGMLQG